MHRSRGFISLPIAGTLPHVEAGLEVDSSSAFLIESPCTLGRRLPATEEEGEGVKESRVLPKLVREDLPPKGIQRLVHTREKPGAKTQACEISGEGDGEQSGKAA